MKCDYLIIGAGISGLFLAYLLKLEKKDVILIEKEDINKKMPISSGIILDDTINLLSNYFKKESEGNHWRRKPFG